MRAVRCPEVEDPEWVAWRREATTALEALKSVVPTERRRIKDDLYKRAMPFLKKIFHDKCAYCESLISNTQPGDVEHYRPKSRVRNLDGTTVKLQGSQDDHPGYWWLCYAWENLLPSCTDCNRRRYHTDKVAGGKADIFPIAGTRAEKPQDSLDQEDALLLNPSEETFKPEDHFEFREDGKVAPKSPRGESSCDLLGLNKREKLVAQRADVYASASSAFSQYLVVSTAALFSRPGDITPEEQKLRQRINDMWEGRTPHSAFARLALANARHMLESRNIRIDLPMPLN
jgi:hypothetical protein